MPGHIYQGQSYYAYANVTDSGAPASGMSSVTTDLSAVTAGQSAATYSSAGGPFSYGGTRHTYPSAALTPGPAPAPRPDTDPPGGTAVAGERCPSRPDGR